MGRVPREVVLNAFVGLTCVAAGGAVGASFLVPYSATWAWWGIILLLATTVLTEAASVRLSHASGGCGSASRVVSVATMPHIASALLLPPPIAAGIAGMAMLIEQMRCRAPMPRLMFNVAVTALSVAAAAMLANALGVAGGIVNTEWWAVLAFVGVAGTYYVVNTLPVVAVTALASGTPFWRSLATSVRYSGPAEFSVAVIGGLAAHVWLTGPTWIIVGIFPAVISQLALRSMGARNRKADQIASLDQLGRALTSAFSVDEVFAAAAAQLRSTGSITGSFVQLLDAETQLADGIAAEPTQRNVAAELSRQVLTTGEPVVMRTAERGASWLVMPLKQGSTLTGSFGLVGDKQEVFNNEDRAYFDLVGGRITIALENARRASELERMAFHDTLTGLPNRALLLDRLSQALLRTGRHGRPVAIVFVDLDNFKLVNDSLGHEAGDSLLRQVADRLRAGIRAEDTLARFGGDEFVVLLEEAATAREATEVAERLASALAQPIEVEGRSMIVQASMGVALSSAGRELPADLLRDADLALYRAKAAGKGRHAIFEPELAAAAMRRLDLENDLRAAIDNGEFRLYYQPVVELAGGELVGWEALVRWQHPERGLIAPTEFIPIAEETGLIVPLGNWVLAQACWQAKQWHVEQSARRLVMSVNLSGKQFLQPGLVEDVRRMLFDADLDARCLKLEITESVVMQDVSLASATLAALSALGVSLAIDDFGTGYSSLVYLKRFPIDTLKIDRSFVSGIVHDTQDAAIVRSIIALAETLNLSVTAEGIETPGQRATLRELGCELGQGYLFGRPVPANGGAEAQQLAA